MDKTCDGVDYHDAFGSYGNVVADGYVSTTMQDHTATINLDENKINLESGKLVANLLITNVMICMTDMLFGNHYLKIVWGNALYKVHRIIQRVSKWNSRFGK